jgi:hypothetical protein
MLVEPGDLMDLVSLFACDELDWISEHSNFPESSQSTNPTRISTPTKKIKQPKPIEQPKSIDRPRQIEQRKPIEQPKPIKQTRQIDQPNQLGIIVQIKSIRQSDTGYVSEFPYIIYSNSYRYRIHTDLPCHMNVSSGSVSFQLTDRFGIAHLDKYPDSVVIRDTQISTTSFVFDVGFTTNSYMHGRQWFRMMMVVNDNIVFTSSPFYIYARKMPARSQIRESMIDK